MLCRAASDGIQRKTYALRPPMESNVKHIIQRQNNDTRKRNRVAIRSKEKEISKEASYKSQSKNRETQKTTNEKGTGKLHQCHPLAEFRILRPSENLPEFIFHNMLWGLISEQVNPSRNKVYVPVYVCMYS